MTPMESHVVDRNCNRERCKAPNGLVLMHGKLREYQQGSNKILNISLDSSQVIRFPIFGSDALNQ